MREDAHAIETYKSLMLYGSAGLKFVLTANGGAAIAILTFLGHFIASNKPNVPDLRWPLAIFLGGVLIGGFATATAYMTQLTLYNEPVNTLPRPPSHVLWLRVTILLILAGMAAFGVGSFWAVSKLQ